MSSSGTPGGGRSDPLCSLNVVLPESMRVLLEARAKGRGETIEDHVKSIAIQSVKKKREPEKRPAKAKIDPDEPAYFSGVQGVGFTTRAEVNAVMHREREFDQVMHQLLAADDRSVGILGATIVDEGLGLLVESYSTTLPCKGSPYRDAFDGKSKGIFSTFGARLLLAHFAGLIGARTHSDIHEMKEIRNRCAHDLLAEDGLQPVSFEQPPLTTRCDKLVTFRKCGIQLVDGREILPTTRRNRFIVHAIEFGRNLSLCAAKVRDGLPPEEVRKWLP